MLKNQLKKEKEVDRVVTKLEVEELDYEESSAHCFLLHAPNGL